MRLKEKNKICVEAAISGGKAVVNYKPEEAKTKGDIHVGHHAIVTSADYKSQEAILKDIREHDNKALFMTEEHVKEKWFRDRIIRSDNLESMLSTRVYIIDELDGSSSKNIGHYEWSTSVGCVESMEHVTGAVFAPHVYGGALFYASKRNGTFLKIGKETERCKVANNSLSDSYVIVGVDCFLSKYPIHNKLLPIIGDRVRTINANGSCALPLGLVAAGRADALIQPPNSPWDWAAGKLLVEEAGGSMLFYDLKDGRIKLLNKLELEHYNPDKRAVGFIAGNEKIVKQLKNILINLSQD